MFLSENFTFAEFERSQTAKQHNIDNRIKADFIRNNIKELVYNVLQPLRDKIGKPVHINSGYRCLELNKLVGGVPTSQHVQGQACDITVKGMSSYEIAKAILELNCNFDQLILYPTFVHVSVSPQERHKVLYNKSYNGKRLK